MLPASDQGQTSQCAAYSLAGILESLKWRDTGEYHQIDPNPIYAGAKRIDGFKGEGTTLDAVLRSAISLGLMPKPKEVFAITDMLSFQRALHRYGFVHLAFNITEAWSHPRPNGWLPEDGHLPQIGGHAVVGCAFDASPAGWVGIQNSWSGGIGWNGFMRMTKDQFKRQFLYGLAWKY